MYVTVSNRTSMWLVNHLSPNHAVCKYVFVRCQVAITHLVTLNIPNCHRGTVTLKSYVKVCSSELSGIWRYPNGCSSSVPIVFALCGHVLELLCYYFQLAAMNEFV